MKLLLFAFLLIQQQHKGYAKVIASGDYFRSRASGDWNAVGSWESSPNGSTAWAAATTVPDDEANTITIRSGHTVSITNTSIVDQVVIENGGVLELRTASSTSLTINDGVGYDIIVQSGGIFKHNIAGTQLPSFVASATIEIQSNGILEAANNNGFPSNYAVTSSGISSHIIWNDGAIFNWNNISSPSSGVTFFTASVAIPVFRFSVASSIGGTAATVINGLLEANANVNLQSTGTKTMRNGITGTGNVSATAASVGQFIINGATAKLGGGSLVLPDAGLLVAASTELTLISNKTINKIHTTVSTINIFGTLVAGDFTISGNCKTQIDGTVKTTNSEGLLGSSNTTFATGISVNSLGATSVIEYNRLGDQLVNPLSYANLNITGNGSKRAAFGEDVFVSGLLNIAAGNTFALNGTNGLKLNGGGTLNINVNAVFDNGGESQVTGSGSPTINLYGTFICRDAQGFTGTNTSIPGATTTPSISLNIYTGSTVEYGRLGDQQVNSRTDYKNMTFSGSGTKAVGTFNPIGTVTIKETAIVDAANRSFGDTTATNLLMTGGRLIVAGNGTKPNIAGTYNLSGGVIEFAGGTLSSRQNIRSAPVYQNIEITGINVGNSNSSTKLANGGSFTVKTGGSYENSGDRIDGSTGTQSFTIEQGATFKTGVAAGFSGSTTEALSNIENISVDPKSTIIYSRPGDQIITPLASGYPTMLLKGIGIKAITSAGLVIASTADSVVIDPLVVLKVGSGAGVNFNNRRVIIHSNSAGSGSIGEIAGGATALLNSTNVTIERYIPARRAFRFLSSPVSTTGSIKGNWMEGQSNPGPAYSVNNNSTPGYGTHITGSGEPEHGFDATGTNNPSLFSFNHTSQEWEAVANTTGTLQRGIAYRLLIRGNRSVDLRSNAPIPSPTVLRSTGALIAGEVVYNQSSIPSISSITDHFSFVGNPYACAVDWDALQKQGLSPYYHVWDPNLNTRGAYVTYGSSISSVSTSQVNQNVQSGQAFFVQTKSPNPSLTFIEANKTFVGRNVFRATANAARLSAQLLLNTSGEPENTADGVVIFFADNVTTGANTESAGKIDNPDENLSIVSSGRLLSILGRQSFPVADTIQLHLTQLRQKNYYLKFELQHFSPGVTVFLKDYYLDIERPIESTFETLFPFTINNDSASFLPTRFSIILKSTAVLQVAQTNIKAYRESDGIQVEWEHEAEPEIERYEVEKSINQGSFEKVAKVLARAPAWLSKKYNWFDGKVTAGNHFYRIKSIRKDGSSEYSRQVNIKIIKGMGSITVSPNPIVNNTIFLTISDIEKGDYNLQIYNIEGQKIYNGLIKFSGNREVFKIPAGKSFPQGFYRLQLYNGTEVTSTNLLILKGL